MLVALRLAVTARRGAKVRQCTYALYAWSRGQETAYALYAGQREPRPMFDKT